MQTEATLRLYLKKKKKRLYLTPVRNQMTKLFGEWVGMVQWLRTILITALGEDLGLLPSIYDMQMEEIHIPLSKLQGWV